MQKSWYNLLAGFMFFLVFAFSFVPTTVFGAPASDCTTYCNALKDDNPGNNLEFPTGKACVCNPLTAEKFTDLIDSILRIIFNIALAIVPLMVVIGGFMFVSAGGKPEQVAKAKNLLLWTVVGFVVILSARGLTKVLMQLLETK